MSGDADANSAGRVYDVIIVGAGPTGLACGIELKRRGFLPLLIDKGCVVNSIYNYPTHMSFFTTPELLEIGDIPMTSMYEKPLRVEALKYYRRVAEHYRLEIRQYEHVDGFEGSDGAFVVHTTCRAEAIRSYTARKIILATGYYDRPNLLGVPGEELDKVFHYYKEPHPFFGHDVLVVGAKNSAAIAALELHWSGARVTLAHRGPALSESIKYWIRPNLENRIKNGEIQAYFNTRVRRILPRSVLLDTQEGEREIANDFVFAMTGYHPDFDFLRRHEIRLAEPDLRPVVDPATLETTRPGVYVAGVIVAGMKTNEIFIENGRFHGVAIAADIARKLSPQPAA